MFPNEMEGISADPAHETQRALLQPAAGRIGVNPRP